MLAIHLTRVIVGGLLLSSAHLELHNTRSHSSNRVVVERGGGERSLGTDYQVCKRLGEIAPASVAVLPFTLTVMDEQGLQRDMQTGIKQQQGAAVNDREGSLVWSRRYSPTERERKTLTKREISAYSLRAVVNRATA
ncbi:unnamed protein product [Gadus morhua 'NCC']